MLRAVSETNLNAIRAIFRFTVERTIQLRWQLKILSCLYLILYYVARDHLYLSRAFEAS